ncbi:MAG: alpha-galactosidase [Paramuribaculum sp.]|nr:alpha-galactosidase [Paramuribaculum sp.]
MRNLLALAAAMTVAAATASTPVMGWSSWNSFRVDISDSLIIRQAEALVATGLSGAGYDHINIDDGFFGRRTPDGRMQPHPARFPGGMKRVARHIHSLGLKAGLYSDAGAVTCGSIWDNDTIGRGAGLYGHEAIDAATYFADWDYDFIKIDYCGAGQELDLDERERYTAIRHAIDSLAGKEVEINICRWAFPGTWAADIASSWRISPDITPSWHSVRNIIATCMPLSGFCRGGHFNDMDMLEIGRGLSANEERVHFGMWCMMSSPLLIGCDLTAIPDESLKLLTNPELIALNQDTLALQAYPVKADAGRYVLVKDIVERRSPVRAVALYNSTDSVAHISIALSDLELQGPATVRDLVSRRPLPGVTDTLSMTVGARDVAILRLDASRRLEPTVYEAEWAYLPLYNALGKRAKEICFVSDPTASGGWKVRYAGGRPENSIIWPEVWSDEGGEYELTVDYDPAPMREIVLLVNGQPADGSRIGLNPGYNTIEITGATAWVPDIDRITLRRL